ncbi:hypothetical protein MKW92_021251 [Papaver armeniacum]|nr:hypothetical protein MKW92_021251 [Papaver armeniacum]
MNSDIDEYLKTRKQGPPFLAELKQRVLLSQGEAIQQLQTNTSPSQQMAHTARMDIFLVGCALTITLMGDLDTENGNKNFFVFFVFLFFLLIRK